MYTIIPLLLAHIQELNKQILFLFKFIVKNIPLNNLSKVAYYNFLRPHRSFKNDVLNHIPELDNIELMPAKWQMLIKLSQELIISKQTT